MLGSHLAEILIKKKYIVYGVDNLIVGKKENLDFNFKNKYFHFLKVDVCNKTKIYNLIKKVDVVVHLAAIKKVTEIQSSYATLDVNVTSTKIVLDGAKKYKKKVIFASTSDVYGVSKNKRSAIDNTNAVKKLKMKIKDNAEKFSNKLAKNLDMKKDNPGDQYLGGPFSIAKLESDAMSSMKIINDKKTIS